MHYKALIKLLLMLDNQETKYSLQAIFSYDLLLACPSKTDGNEGKEDVFCGIW